MPKNLTTLWTLQSLPRRYIAQTHTREPIDRAPEIVEVTNQILWWRLSSSSWLESKKIWNNLCERKNQYISVRKSKRVVWQCIKTTGRTVSSHLNSKRCKRKNCSNCYWNRGSSIYMHSALYAYSILSLIKTSNCSMTMTMFTRFHRKSDFSLNGVFSEPLDGRIWV